MYGVQGLRHRVCGTGYSWWVLTNFSPPIKVIEFFVAACYRNRLFGNMWGGPQGRGFLVEGSRYRVRGRRFAVQGLRYRVQGLRYKVRGRRFAVQGLGFQGLGYEV